MAMRVLAVTVLVSLHLHAWGLIRAEGRSAVPAIFIFGDSLVDVGNNNYLPLSMVKADFPFNGIDFENRKPTGRFSNGKNAADFIAEKMGLPSPPAFLSLKEYNLPLWSGVNFASGGSGILNTTGENSDRVIPLTKQVDNYQRVHGCWLKKLGSQNLSKSLYVILIGSNDIFDYANSMDMQKKITPQQLIGTMTSTMRDQITRLHTHGASRFVLPGTAFIGCTPIMRIHRNGECDEDVNSWSQQYNAALKKLLKQLQLELKDFRYSFFDTFSALKSIITQPSIHGFTEVKAACCGVGDLRAEVPCLPISTLCPNRRNHVFWDLVHPTEKTIGLIINSMISGSNHTLPFNVNRLIST